MVRVRYTDSGGARRPLLGKAGCLSENFVWERKKERKKEERQEEKKERKNGRKNENEKE